MGIFSSIMDKIFHHKAAAPAAAPVTAAPTTAAVAPPPPPPVDVKAVLAALAAEKGGGGNYDTSIVDLLKLLDMDSSLASRKELGDELNIQVGADGSAEQNIALHKAVLQKLAENGGHVPANLKD